MKNLIKKIYFLTVVFTLIVTTYFFRNELFPLFLHHWLEFTVLCVTTILYIGLQGFNFVQLLGKQTKKLPFTYVFHTWTLANLVNYLGPFQPGIVARIALFKFGGLSIKKSTATTVRQIYLNIWVGLILCWVSLFFLDIKFKYEMITTLLLITLACPLILKVLRDHLPSHFFSIPINNDIYDSIYDALISPEISVLLTFVTLYCISTLNIFLVYSNFSTEITIPGALLISVFASLSGLISITPNNLGIQELILGYSAHLLGLSAPDAVAIATIFRISHITGSFVGHVISSILHATNKSTARIKNIEIGQKSE